MKSLLCLLSLLSLAFVQGSPPLQLEQYQGFGPEFLHSGIFAEGIRLPTEVVPVHYDVQIRPIIDRELDDPLQFTAPGEVIIRVKCVAPTENITLHYQDMTVDGDWIWVRTAIGQSVNIWDLHYDASLSQFTIQMEEQLEVGAEYDVYIRFEAKVGNRLSGLYRSSYKDSQGNTKWLATTQFQSTGARMAFPCFDEPGLRATFKIIIGRAEGYHSLTNSPLIRSDPIPEIDGWFWDIHESTVSMPSYLVAMIVSDFVAVEAPNGIAQYDVKIWGPPTMTDETTAQFSSKAAAQIVTFFENYLESTYQFPKLDSAAIPDFAAGAMENWALNTYRIAYLLYFEGESTQREQWLEAAVIGHEISHHWFGDLVTCNWWNDIWLNEGFASYMEIIGANSTDPNFAAMDRYPIDKIQIAMDVDAGPTTTPIRNNVTDQFSSVPSRITYEKGASIIRMMQSFLSEATFIRGIRNYLDTYAYNNTVQDQLFAELQAQADADGSLTEHTVKEIMDTWTLKSGFPIVKVNYVSGNTVEISQEKFRLNSSSPNDHWFVPVTYATRENPDFSASNWKPKLWLDDETSVATHMIDGLTANDWVIVNPDARSYYKTIYDDHFFQLITAQLNANHEVISLASRSQIFDDYFKSVFAGYVDIKEALELLPYLSAETDNTVWTTVSNNLRQINRLLQDASFYPRFTDYLLSKVTPVLDTIGWQQMPNDEPVTVFLRTTLLDWACTLGSQMCETVATQYMISLSDGSSAVPADVQPMIYCKALNIWDSINIPDFQLSTLLLDGYRQATRAERSTVFVNSLACEGPNNIVTLLEAVIVQNPFTSAHGIQILQRLAENRINRGILMTLLFQNLNRIVSSLGESSISSVVTSMAGYTSDLTMREQLSKFIDDVLPLLSSESVKASLETSRAQLDINAEWVANYGTKIGEWLNQ